MSRCNQSGGVSHRGHVGAPRGASGLRPWSCGHVQAEGSEPRSGLAGLAWPLDVVVAPGWGCVTAQLASCLRFFSHSVSFEAIPFRVGLRGLMAAAAPSEVRPEPCWEWDPHRFLVIFFAMSHCSWLSQAACEDLLFTWPSGCVLDSVPYSHSFMGIFPCWSHTWQVLLGERFHVGFCLEELVIWGKQLPYSYLCFQPRLEKLVSSSCWVLLLNFFKWGRKSNVVLLLWLSCNYIIHFLS